MAETYPFIEELTGFNTRQVLEASELASALGLLAAARGDGPFAAVALDRRNIGTEYVGINSANTENNPLRHSESKVTNTLLDSLGVAAMGEVAVFVPGDPCSTCLHIMAQSGIRHMFFGKRPLSESTQEPLSPTRITGSRNNSRLIVELMGQGLLDFVATGVNGRAAMQMIRSGRKIQRTADPSDRLAMVEKVDLTPLTEERGLLDTSPTPYLGWKFYTPEPIHGLEWVHQTGRTDTGERFFPYVFRSEEAMNDEVRKKLNSAIFAAREEIKVALDRANFSSSTNGKATLYYAYGADINYLSGKSDAAKVNAHRQLLVEANKTLDAIEPGTVSRLMELRDELDYLKDFSSMVYGSDM